MMRNNRLGAKLAAASMVALVAACASPGGSGVRSASIFGGKVDKSNIGLATRAQLALADNKVDEALSLAERAVANSPNDAGFRALLGNVYLAAGRFSSAETAFRESLTLVNNQPQQVLKLALVQIALGKGSDAASLLASAQTMLDPADLGLALALSGDAASAVQLLDASARQPGADARLRQNLALAHALAGDWTQARVVAAQDVPADQLDARLEQWMALAQPARPSDQVAAFIGIQPVASDPGQPTRLALNASSNDTRQAEAATVPAPAPVVALPVEVASAVTVDLPPPAPVEVAQAETVEPPPVQEPVSAPVIEASAPVESAPVARPALSREVFAKARARSAVAARPTAGNSRAVVQLGAYSSREQLAGAWARRVARQPSLRSYEPVTARFTTTKGTFYRLSVKGFASQRDAIALCGSLKRAGGNCFVRATFNDAPVRFAQR
ncbi:tetratricopeptide repeat protein [Sphingomonas sp. LY160]|uniref:tetratricopeptide repeat protein n=1 Tax=Sphingomonas sp. LY160 TaxID=3095342 RepID=UPI002ADECAB3|nr:tetratricopeptide repeat protein [Sphingomonas sp. LY160]MEA1071059.1 SPOR domain-containing protein [Sphingomonas sp. LY160]